jgi:putative Mg2+ transporter-C (MgtC) family protein
MDWIESHAVQLGVLARVALAMLFGALIGLEREFRDKPAGLRTHMLTAGAAALLVSLSSTVIESVASEVQSGLVDSDPVRMIGAVVTGVSFLGAGTILRRGREQGVEGLTTAASLLLAAAVGVCTSLSQWVVAIGTTILVLIVLRGVSRAECWLSEHRAKLEGPE